MVKKWETIKRDYAALDRTAQAKVELGFGFEGKLKSGPYEAKAGVTLHDEKTISANDKKITDGSPIKDKLEGSIGVKAAGIIEASVEKSAEHEAGKNIEVKPFEPKLSFGGEDSGQVNGPGERIGWGASYYAIIGGGFEISVDQGALTRIVGDILSISSNGGSN